MSRPSLELLFGTMLAVTPTVSPVGGQTSGAVEGAYVPIRASTDRSPISLIPSRTALFAIDSSSLTDRLRLDTARPGNRAQHALIGGLIGGVAGVIACTAISNAIKDPGTGFSTCTTKGYLYFGVGGAALGALIGSLFE